MVMNGPRAGLGGMSGAGLLVTFTVCFALLMSLGTVCFMAANGLKIPDELVTITTGLILSATGLLAKTWADRPDERGVRKRKQINIQPNLPKE